jgi:hypothetical protein
MRLSPQILISRRVKEKLRSGEMTVCGDQWPAFLYAGLDYDAEDPWKGLLRNPLLVSVSAFSCTFSCYMLIIITHAGL